MLGQAEMRTRRVLVVSFAFPPMQVQMTPVAARAVVELSRNGFTVDVVAAGGGAWHLPIDLAWSGYVEPYIADITRIKGNSFERTRFRSFAQRLWNIPDPMIQLVRPAAREILSRGPGSYSAILSISPFHSVNHLMVILKRAWPHVPWIAYFGDPWASNPLEKRFAHKFLNRWSESRALSHASVIGQTSTVSLKRLEDRYPQLSPGRMRHVPHTFDGALYPKREREKNKRFTFRFLGTLFGRRSPAPVLAALRFLLDRRPEMRTLITVEFIGVVEPNVQVDWHTGVLSSVVNLRPAVSYFRSLELMYDADALLMIEADIPDTPFMPSKLADYLGANTPILGIVPRGECRDVLTTLGASVHAPRDIEGIASSLEAMVDASNENRASWCNQDVRRLFDLSGRQDGLAAIVREVCEA